MKNESRFLLQLFRADVGSITALEVHSDRLLELASRHQVDALVYWFSKNEPRLANEDSLPRSTLEELRLSFLHHTMRNELLGRNLEALHDALAREGIDFVVFKGPWLAFDAYPAPGTRPVEDIDLGIHEADYRGAYEVLASLGYQAHTLLPETPSAALGHAHYRQQLRFSAPGLRPVELHFRMVNFGPPSKDERWMWEHRRSTDVGGRSIPVPGHEAMLLHLLLHAHQHGFAVLRILLDIRYALARDRAQLDMDAFIELARRLHCTTSAYHGLLLARDLAGASVEQRWLDALRPGPLERRVFESIWRISRARQLECKRVSMRLEGPLFYLLGMGSPWQKLRFLAGILGHLPRWPIRSVPAVRPLPKAL